jgi:hypothetical protein
MVTDVGQTWIPYYGHNCVLTWNLTIVITVHKHRSLITIIIIYKYGPLLL